jgi:osmotically-inducible protein OsmY
MANDYRNRGDVPRGMFGYEGEGFMIERGGSDLDRPRPSYRGRGPKGYQRPDERIREDVCERLSYDDYVDASEIEVVVSAGLVTLTGSVDERSAKRRAEDIAESVTGVREVENQIRVNRMSTY